MAIVHNRLHWLRNWSHAYRTVAARRCGAALAYLLRTLEEIRAEWEVSDGNP